MRVWLNGAIMDESEARVSPFDRGFIFGDGVYEGIRFFNGVGVGMDLHIERLRRSLASIGIRGFDADSLSSICDALLADGGLADAMVYLQVTRGVQSPRQHLPVPGLRPTVFGYAAAAPSLEDLAGPSVRSCITLEDIRWHRCEIKCTSLLANVLGVMEADRRGVDEPIFCRNGLVGEGAMTNVLLVRDGVLVTPPLDGDPPILHGVTRAIILDVAPAMVPGGVDERPVAVDELHTADEVMIASSRRLLDSIGRIDGVAIGEGGVGPVATALLAALKWHLAAACGMTLHST
jgi:D-alanine transaminase